MIYRPEIDGLRAFAIIPVVLYHAGFSWMSGGYLGVDLFFVISGFLITGIIAQSLEDNEFSLTRFYERRVRRIIPAMAVVVAVTLLLVPIFGWHWQVEEAAQSAIFSTIFLSNYYFLGTVDYFRSDAHTYPLLHLWSLSIEEQYYLFAPIILWALWKIRIGFWGSVLTVSIVSILSFAAADAAAANHPERVFYLIQYRAFELGIGSLAALLVFRYGRISYKISALAGPVFLVAIVASMFMVPGNSVDPWLKLPLLLGAAGILCSTYSSGAFYSLLAWTPLRYVGLISFSLYLWHQPLLAFFHLHTGGAPGSIEATILIIATFVLATLTYRLVETPFRVMRASRGRILRLGAGILVSLVAVSIMTLGSVSRLKPSEPIIAQLAAPPAERVEDLWRDYRPLIKVPFTSDRTRVLVIGDSYSQDFVLAAHEFGAFEDAEVSAIYVRTICQVYYGKHDISEHWRDEHLDTCSKSHGSRFEHEILISEADVVIVAASWQRWSAERIADTYKYLDEHAGDVIIIGLKAFRPDDRSRPHLREYRQMGVEERQSVRGIIPHEMREIDKLMKERTPESSFVSVFDTLCDDSCPIFTPDGYIISHDGGHLTRAGAAFIGPQIFDHPTLQRFLQKLADTTKSSDDPGRTHAYTGHLE